MDKRIHPAFKQALLDAALEEFKDIPAEKDIDLEFSEEFEAWGQSMTASPKQAVRPLRKSLRRLILIAAILAALVTTAMATPAIREALIKFFAHNADTHYEFSFDPEQAATAPRYIEQAYLPTYIPDGYTAETVEIHPGFVTGLWSSESGGLMIFNQLPIPNDGEGPAPDAEDVAVEILNLNGYEVFCVYAEGYMYYWTDNEYFYQLYFSPSISKEDSIKVFFSIAPTEETNITE